jgi:Pyruvate/2-oxoacid:ferredoxin oxidoreductase delta subunit
MSDDVYSKLREQLDQYSIGYPETESGVEIKILKKLFTEEEAELFLLLNLIAETPEVISERAGQDQKELAGILHQMAEKGLVFRLKKGDRIKYAAVPFMIGIYDFQGGNIDRELAELFEQYCEEGFDQAKAKGAVVMRPIPVHRSIDISHTVATYEDSREIVKDKKRIAVMNCICRNQQKLIGKGCEKPIEVCMTFGPFADYFIDRKEAREITVEDAFEILERSEKAGLVPQPSSSQNPVALCNCCGDCCAMLGALNKQPQPAQMVVSNYYAVVDPDLCTACETCLERCQMSAIALNEDDIAQVNIDRCIGCGLCVDTCTGQALRLEHKPEGQRVIPPKKEGYVQKEMAKKRGASLTPFALRGK